MLVFLGVQCTFKRLPSLFSKKPGRKTSRSKTTRKQTTPPWRLVVMVQQGPNHTRRLFRQEILYYRKIATHPPSNKFWPFNNQPLFVHLTQLLKFLEPIFTVSTPKSPKGDLTKTISSKENVILAKWIIFHLHLDFPQKIAGAFPKPTVLATFWWSEVLPRKPARQRGGCPSINGKCLDLTKRRKISWTRWGVAKRFFCKVSGS